MSVLLSPVGNAFQFLTSGGLPLNGGFLYTYAAGGSTPTATYTTSLGNVQNSNPIQLNSDGRCPNEIWFTPGQSYKFVLNDSLGTLLGTYDNLYGINDLQALSNNTFNSLVRMTAGLSVGGGLTVTSGGITVSGASTFNSGVTFTSGTNTLTNTRLAKTTTYTLANADKGVTLALGGTAFYTLTVNAASGYDANFICAIVNEDTTRAKRITINGITSFLLWPLQSFILINQNSTWQTIGRPVRYKPAAALTLYVDHANGLSTNDGLATGAGGALNTIANAISVIMQQIDCNNNPPTIQNAAETFTETGASVFGQPTGALQILITGTPGAPSSTVWQVGAAGTVLQTRDNGVATINGFKILSTGAGAVGFNPSQNGTIDYLNIEFGAFATGYQIKIDQGGCANSLDSGATLPSISGSATNHCLMVGPCKWSMGGATINMPNALTFGSFLSGSGTGTVNFGANTFTGAGSGAGSVGQKFALNGNFIAFLGGTVLPGATAGAVTNGALSL